VETGSGGHVEHALGAPLLELPDEEIAFTLVAGVPVDQFIPLVDESFDVFLLIVIGIADLYRVAPEFLFRCKFWLSDDRCSLGEVNENDGISDGCGCPWPTLMTTGTPLEKPMGKRSHPFHRNKGGRHFHDLGRNSPRKTKKILGF
jgi:hypothetical protein